MQRNKQLPPALRARINRLAHQVAVADEYRRRNELLQRLEALQAAGATYDELEADLVAMEKEMQA
ncbi:hypothetical protein [Aquabacterium sp. A08]|uniref:hypothetical protein n=1 Tax=Aquabacterium sp. A08 TaxID=2718532 RepID=UPI00141FDBA7|nr:hypothetical protein [Aquabacterium sp. A08]NIC43319.1 hypothetical protein [Aquabacterium sp. A08]